MKLKHFSTGLIVITVATIVLTGCNSKSTFKIIDTHEHVENLVKAKVLEKADDAFDVQKTILLASPIETITLNGSKTFSNYQKNIDEILNIAALNPDRFVPFCTLNPKESPLEVFKSCVERGGKGLKLYNGHSYYYDIFGLPLNAKEMMPVYDYAEVNHIPLVFHINVAKYEAELRAVLDSHPNLVMSIPHFMVSSIQLDRVTKLFDDYPNLYTDVSFGSPEFMAAGFRRISGDTEKFRTFAENYSDRILFGTDMVLSNTKTKDESFMRTTLECYRNMLEQKHFTCDPVKEYYQGESEKNKQAYENCQLEESDCNTEEEKMNSFTKWYGETKKLNGLGLSDEILQKIYWENPNRFLNANRN